ncbi:MAG: hypothetical protein ACOCXM_04755 [Myxococcota bacterium]
MIDDGHRGDVRRGSSLPGVRQLDALEAEEWTAYGTEARALARLAAAGLPLAPGWLVRLADEPETRLVAAVEQALQRSEVVRLRPALPTDEAAARWDRAVGVPRDVRPGEDLRAHADALIDALRRTFGSTLFAWAVRVLACDAAPCGRAVSADTGGGDPDELGVWTREEPAARWHIDRRTLRATHRGGGLDSASAEHVGDLADRAQLVLGRPIELEWGWAGEQLVIVGLRFITLPTRFGVGTWRRVALVAADEGTVAPLAVDALDRALGGDGGSHPAVRRIFARPYRRMDTGVTRFRPASAAVSMTRAGARLARVGADLATPLAATGRFHGEMNEVLAALDAMPLPELDDRVLVEAIRERHALVADAFSLLDRAREATGALLAALEATVGPLGREAIGTLAAPRPTRWRQGVEESLRQLGREVRGRHGRLVAPEEMRRDLAQRWARMRRELIDARPLGIDVRPDAMGVTDAAMREAILDAMGPTVFPSDSHRATVARRVRVHVRGRPFGRARETMAAALTLLLKRVAHAKGAVVDDLAAALLRLRRAAMIAGDRLVDRGVLEVSDDALYLQVSEMEEALSHEPGAYAARTRLRREDDARWAEFEAPRRIEGRQTSVRRTDEHTRGA